MLKRIYIDNYGCFSNFEWKPGTRVLLAGRNGSGKTELFGVLLNLRLFLTRQATTLELFPSHSLTAWDSRSKQTFELSIDSEGQEYHYRLVIEHDRPKSQSRIFHESLMAGETVLYEYKDSEAHLYRDNGSSGPAFPTDWSRSLIATLGDRPDNQRLIKFRDRMRRVHIFRLDPLRMAHTTQGEDREAKPQLENIASWLRHLQAEDSGFATRITEALKPILPGFTRYGLNSDAEGERIFSFYFSPQGNPTSEYAIPFHHLSDGQRSLVALYIILDALVRPDSTLCFDEPDNFIALREIQPWLLQLQDCQEETGCQCLIISHHPEIIDFMTPMEDTVLFERDNGSLVRHRPFEWGDSDGVSASELMARGWENND